jgi:hypothetical protein
MDAAMKMYLDADMVYDELQGLRRCNAQQDVWAEGWDDAISALEIELENMPSADVRPVMHGEWRSGAFGGIVCSVCGHWARRLVLPKFCEGCGAKMGER